MDAGVFEPVVYPPVYCGLLVTTECTAMHEVNAVPDFSTPKTIWISFLMSPSCFALNMVVNLQNQLILYSR